VFVVAINTGSRSVRQAVVLPWLALVPRVQLLYLIKTK
jgi:hypothetical protein